MEKIEPIYYLNGKFIPKSQAKISVNDLGWLRGYGVFDFLITYNGIPFYLDSHVNRLFRSSNMVGLSLPFSRDELKRLVLKTLSFNSFFKEKSIRIVVSGGESENSITPVGKPTTAILVEKLKKYPKRLYKNGAEAITHEFRRTIPLSKTIDYLFAVQAIKMAKKQGAIEVIYINKRKNIVYEGTRSNVFIVRSGKIKIPKDDVLPGITAQVVCDLIKKDHTLVKDDISINELYDADEVFITASNIEIMPIVKIDGKKLKSGKVGPVTKVAMGKFKEYTARWNGKEKIN